LGIQRQHDPERSEEITRFVEFGYPWSTLSEAKRATAEYNDLRKPGWLPTAIVVNILNADDVREGRKISSADVVTVRDVGAECSLSLPYSKWSEDWQPTTVPPLEVIDGQHRLWAFDGKQATSEFEVPVVAFHGLDISWQAYLFWTINIKPKRINASLAFDLYPLLRAEDWLERAEEHIVYRDTRSQELTEALWSYPQSPWYDKINMLGERGNPWVSQAAWIRSLSTSFVRAWDPRGARGGGLFGGRVGDGGEVLGWSRAQQAAFLIFAWQQLYAEIHNGRYPWAMKIRGEAKRGERFSKQTQDDPAFYGPHSLLVTDQGVRGFLQVVNDLCYAMASKLKLSTWNVRSKTTAPSDDAITVSLRSLEPHPVANFLKRLAHGLASFDWRSSSADDLSDDERRLKLVFRGSSGYRELRLQLLSHLGQLGNDVAGAAKRLSAVAR